MAASEYTVDIRVSFPIFHRARMAVASYLVRLAMALAGSVKLVEARAMTPEEKLHLHTQLGQRYRGTWVGEDTPEPRGLDLAEATTPTTDDSEGVRGASLSPDYLAALSDYTEQQGIAAGNCRRCRRAAMVTTDSSLCPGCRVADAFEPPAGQGDGITRITTEQLLDEWFGPPKCEDCGADGVKLLEHTGARVCWGCFDRRQTTKGRICVECGEPVGDTFTYNALGSYHPECGEVAQARAERGGYTNRPTYDPKLDPANCYECAKPLGATIARGRYSMRPYHPRCLAAQRETVNANVLG